MTKEKIKWHPAFAAAIQLEFKEYDEYLEYILEHELTYAIIIDVLAKSNPNELMEA